MVLPPDINISTDVCAIVDSAIVLPLTAVLGLAGNGCSAIIQERGGGNFSSYDDFCARIAGRAVNSKVRRNLIKAGAFDHLHNRTELLTQQLEIESPDILALEHEVLDIYVTGHPLDCFDYSDGTIHIAEVNALPIGSEFKTVGIVEKLKGHKDRNGGNMAFIKIEDTMCQMEVVIFASVYRGNLQTGMIIRIHGKLDQLEPLKQMTSQMVDEYKAKRVREGATPKTVNNELDNLSHMMKMAVRWGYVNHNVVANAEKMKVPRRPPRFLRQDEIQRLLSAADGSYIYPLIMTALHTGMRKSELLNLKWSDIDFDQRIVIVQHKDDWHTKN